MFDFLKVNTCMVYTYLAKCYYMNIPYLFEYNMHSYIARTLNF